MASHTLTPDDNCNSCKHGRRSTVTISIMALKVVHCKKNILDPQGHQRLRQIGANRPEFRCVKFQSRDPRRR